MQLLYPWFSLAALAVIVPVVIHFLELRRPKRLLFTNNAFVKEVELTTVRHRKVQQLLILMARGLALSTLVVVFCQPFNAGRVKQPLQGIAGVEVLIDNSFSMQLPSVAEGNLFEEAVSKCINLGLGLPKGAGIRLVNSGKNLMTLTDYRTKLNALRLDPLTPFDKILDSSNNGQAGSNELYVFSDFQKSTFTVNTFDAIRTGTQVVLVPLSGKRTANIFVDSIWLEDTFVRTRTNVAMHVRLRNGGDMVAKDCPVKVFLGSRQVAAFRVTVEPRNTVNSVVQVQTNDENLLLGRVLTEDAPITFDNTYYFTWQAATAIRVLEIGSEPVAKELYEGEPVFEYSFAKPQNVNNKTLQLTNMVLLREVGEVNNGLRDGLREVLKRGGSVVIVPSALVAGRDSYRQLFKELGLGAVQWQELTDKPEMSDVAMPSIQEPFFRDVFGEQQRAATMPRVAPVLRWTRTGTDILRLRDGESYLAGFTSGLGKAYVFSAPFTKDYSNFVAHALFVPVMYRLAMLSYRNEQLPSYRLSQGTIALQLPAALGATEAAGRADEAAIRLVKDSLMVIPAQRLFGKEVRLDVPVEMNVPGFYQVQRRGKALTTLAFNQDKKESDLAAYSADELRQMIGPNRPNIRVLEHGTGGSGFAEFRAEQTGQPLWRYFLALALVCLLAEALLVRFGGRQGNAKARTAA